jgi:hypothetical protein
MNPSADTALDLTRTAHLISLVKENQLTTALVCFLLWQIGALATAQSYVGGVMC